MSDYLEWHLSKSINTTGQSLVIHGLNTKPEKMMDIVYELNSRGQDVLLLKLIGHNNDLDEMRRVNYKKWNEQVATSFQTLMTINKTKGGSINLVAYSLGATLALDVLAHDPTLLIDQAILFSPAIKVKTTSHLVKIFRILGGGFVVPSLSAEAYKAQRGTTVAAYNALFHAIDSFSNGMTQQLNFPTTVLIDKDDEMVSYEGICEIANSLSNWNIISINNKNSTMEKSFHHLTITQESVGKSDWNSKILPVFDKHFGNSL